MQRFARPRIGKGYIRPNFITCEWDGNNALSPLRRPQPARPASSALPIEPVKGNLFRAMTLFAVRYYLAKTAGAVFFRGNVHHRSRGILSEAVLWTRNFCEEMQRFARPRIGKGTIVPDCPDFSSTGRQAPSQSVPH